MYKALLPILSAFAASSQCIVQIQAPPARESASFSLVSVTNATGRDNIGSIGKQGRTKLCPARFKQELSNEILSFFREAYSFAPGSAQLELRVLEFRIGLNQYRNRDTAFVLSKFEFLLRTSSGPVPVYTFEERLYEGGGNLEFTHGNRIKRVLQRSVSVFQEHSMKLRLDAIIDSLGPPASEPAISDTSRTPKTPARTNIVFIGTHAMLTPACAQYGLNFNFLKRFPLRKRNFAGLNIRYSYTEIYRLRLPSPFNRYEIHYLDAGLRHLYHLGSCFFLSSALQVLLGKEKLEEARQVPGTFQFKAGAEKIQIFKGAELNAGIFLTHPDRPWLTTGADFLVRLTNSDYMTSNYGISAMIGFSF